MRTASIEDGCVGLFVLDGLLSDPPPRRRHPRAPWGHPISPHGLRARRASGVETDREGNPAFYFTATPGKEVARPTKPISTQRRMSWTAANPLLWRRRLGRVVPVATRV
jgi:hypothetical protein